MVPDPIRTRFLGYGSGGEPALRSPWWFAPGEAAAGGWRRLWEWLTPRADGRCPHCGERAGERLCPGCHASLPYDAARAGPGAEIAVCGAQSAGKTTYLAAGIPRLRRILARERGMIVEPADEAVRRRLVMDLEGGNTGATETGEEGELATAAAALPSPTRTLRTDRQALDPYLFRVARAGEARVRFLAFYDMAGEDWEMPPAGLRGTGFGAAGGYLLFVDPLVFPGLARERRVQRGGGSGAGRALAEPPGVDRLALLLGESPVRVPVAVVLGKLDCWVETLEPGLELVQTARDPVGVGQDDTVDAAIHEEILALLERWGCGEFVRAVEHHAPEHRYFAVSALGEAGHAGGGLGLSMPMMVERPLWWLLERQGFFAGGLQGIRRR